MDVSLRLSLQGGHHWEFVCDEDDPMVAGLISALPGATLDSALPPDGLIQVEARNGQRLFLSRSSLVAVTINRVSAQRPAGDAMPFLASTSFVTRTDVFDGATIDQLLAQSPSAKTDNAGSAGSLPAPGVDALVRLLSDAKACLMPEYGGETHLDLDVHRLPGVATFRLPMERKSARLLDFVISLTRPNAGSPGLVVSLPDRWIGGEHTDGQPTARTLPLELNAALVFRSAKEFEALDLQLHSQANAPAVLSGSLCQGAAVGSR
jgi:hypothetical protein